MKPKVFTPTQLGLSAVVVANGAPVTSSAFSLFGARMISVYVYLDRTAATRLDVKLQTSPKGGSAAADFCEQAAESVASGVGTLSVYEQQFTVSGDVAQVFKFKNLASLEGRLVIEGVGGTADTISAYVVADA